MSNYYPGLRSSPMFSTKAKWARGPGGPKVNRTQCRGPVQSASGRLDSSGIGYSPVFTTATQKARQAQEAQETPVIETVIIIHIAGGRLSRCCLCQGRRRESANHQHGKDSTSEVDLLAPHRILSPHAFQLERKVDLEGDITN